MFVFIILFQNNFLCYLSSFFMKLNVITITMVMIKIMLWNLTITYIVIIFKHTIQDLLVNTIMSSIVYVDILNFSCIKSIFLNSIVLNKNY